MSTRVIRCAIEELADWHPHMLLDSYIASFVAVTGQYSVPPASFTVSCEGLSSRWTEGATGLELHLSWTEETINKAERLRLTMQQGPIVEHAAIAVALLLAHHFSFGHIRVADHGDRVDFRAVTVERALEVSGTEVPSRFARRERTKAKQALSNPYRWDAFVFVALFCEAGHRVLVSEHSFLEATRGEAQE